MNDSALCPCIKRNGSLCNSNLAENNFTHFIGCKSHGFHLKHHNVLEDSILGCCIDGLRSRIIRGQAGAYLNDDKRPRAKGNLRVNLPCTPGQYNEEHSFFAPGNQADGFILYNGHLDENLFQVIRNRLGPNPNHNPNTLQNRKEAFHQLLQYCLDRNLKLEHWDVHFCQGSSKQLKTNERTKAQTYATAWEDFCRQDENEDALRRLRDLNTNSGGAPTVSLIGMSLSGAFSEGATDFLTRMANIKFPTPISDSTLSHLPARSRWMDWTMRIIQRNVLESIGTAVTSGIRLWKATAPTALHRDNVTENTEWRYCTWPTGSRRSIPSESDTPPEISIYSDSGWDSFEPNIPLDESRKDTPRRTVPSGTDSIHTVDRVSNTLPEIEPINMDHLLKDHQRAINLLTTGTQTEKQRFVDLLIARRDQEWEARKTAPRTRRTPRKPDIYRYAESRGINSSLIRPFYELPIASPQKKSRQSITIRRNKQSTSTAKSLSPYLNRTESSHSSNSKRAPNMIPCFPANSNTHITEDSLPNISQIRTRSTTKQLNHCLENQQEYSLKYTNTGKRSCRVITESSQEDYTDEHPYSIVSNRPSTYRTRSVTERLKQQDDYTNEHPYDTAPNRSSAFHTTEDSPPNTSQNRTRSTTKQSNHCLENQKGGYYLRYTKTGKRSCRIITDSSQDD